MNKTTATFKSKKVFIIQPAGYQHSPCFNEIAEAFSDALPDGHPELFFGAHLLNSVEGRLFSDRVVYQSEQITSECYWMQPHYLELLKRNEVWDYSIENVRVLQKLGVNARHVPVRFVPCMVKFGCLPDEQKDIDVLFYGSTNPRRLKILKQLHKAGVKVTKIFDKYGKERDEYIARAKIVLNLHYFDSGIFEIFRCAHLFANSKCVITEWGRDKDLDAAHLKSAVFHRPEHIVEACQYYLKNNEKRRDQEIMAFEAFLKPTLKESIK